MKIDWEAVAIIGVCFLVMLMGNFAGMAKAQDDISTIKIPLGYKEVGTIHNKNVFNFTFNGESGINSILSADVYFNTLTVLQNNTPTRFNLTINNTACRNDFQIQNYAKTSNVPIQYQLYYSCGNRITGTGFYFVNLSSNQSFNNTWGWVEITYKNTILNSLNQNLTSVNNTGRLSVVATEYYLGEDAVVSASVVNGNLPVLTASCLITVFYPNRTAKMINGGSMTHNENGIYHFNVSRNNFTFGGNYPTYVNCSYTVLAVTTVLWSVGEINMHDQSLSSNGGGLLVTGTEYFIGEDAKPNVLDLDKAGVPTNLASCLLTSFFPNNTKQINGQALTLLENGVYTTNISRNNFTFVGNYPFYINCTTSPPVLTNWALGEFNIHDTNNLIRMVDNGQLNNLTYLDRNLQNNFTNVLQNSSIELDDINNTLLGIGRNITNANFSIQQNVTTTISNHQTSLFTFLNANFTDVFGRLDVIKNTLLMHDLSMKNNFTYTNSRIDGMDTSMANNFTNLNNNLAGNFSFINATINTLSNSSLGILNRILNILNQLTSQFLGTIF